MQVENFFLFKKNWVTTIVVNRRRTNGKNIWAFLLLLLFSMEVRFVIYFFDNNYNCCSFSLLLLKIKAFEEVDC